MLCTNALSYAYAHTGSSETLRGKEKAAVVKTSQLMCVLAVNKWANRGILTPHFTITGIRVNWEQRVWTEECSLQWGSGGVSRRRLDKWKEAACSQFITTSFLS